MTTSTYTSLKAQIQELERQAEAIRNQEVQQVIANIKAQMAEYGLTAADLGTRGVRGMKAAKPTGVPKYRDPDSGRTWTGHGKPPTWIAGKNRDLFLIDGAPSAPVEEKAPKAAKGSKTVAAKPVKAVAKAEKAEKAPVAAKRGGRAANKAGAEVAA